MPEIVPVYAGLLGLVFVYLSIRVIRTRRQEQVARRRHSVRYLTT